MTAIAAVYVPSGWIIAADGRCRSDDETPTPFDTDQAQKIFAIENENRTFAYSLIGFAGTNDGKFRLVDEIAKVSEILAHRRFDDCGSYIQKFCHNLQRAVNKARRDGRISEFPDNEHLPPDRRNNVFRILFVGYFKQHPWQLETRFLRDEQNRTHFTIESVEPRETTSAITGSDIVANAIYRDNDPRFARYIKPRIVDTLDWATEYVRGYIEACADPLAVELDPLCKRIGGHTHIAEITSSGGFKWRTAPRQAFVTTR
jgi:hypothetical protein